VLRRDSPQLAPSDTLTGVSTRIIQIGQLWRHDASGDNYLVTKIYDEALGRYAVLRKAEAINPAGDTVRVKIQKTAQGAALPGYTYTQELQEF
jgi:hypothetical protein